MNTRRSLVEKAITFQHPERIPVVFWNCDQTEGDLLLYHLSLGAEGEGTPNAWDWSTNEWGYQLVKLGDGTMGHPVAPYYVEMPAPGAIRVPALREAERLSALPAFQERCGDRYRLASLDLSGFTVYTLLRGFEQSMQDFLIDPGGFAKDNRFVAFPRGIKYIYTGWRFHSTCSRYKLIISSSFGGFLHPDS